MHLRLLLTILISNITTIPYSQTPQQYYFDWTEMPFSREELAERRHKLIQQIRNDFQNGMVLIPARDGFSYGETFRQLDDFYYFTGLELPNSILAIDIYSASAIVYAPARDKRFESSSRPNDFPGSPILDDPAISNKSGLALNNINQLGTVLDQQKLILLNNGTSGDLNYASIEYVTSYSPVQILMQALEQKHPNLEINNIYDHFARVRMVKSAAEIKLMRRSINITIEGIKLSAKEVKPGIDERYLEGILEGSYKVNGSSRLAFGSIIKSGPNSLWPWRILATHYDRNNRVLQNGELVIFDVGCEYMNYVSDVGRTFPVSGQFTPRQKEILEMEIRISDQIIDYIKPGVTFSDLSELTDKIIPAEAKKYMQASLFFGHHLGLSTGDPNLDIPLQPGMIFTVEPWYYNHDEGISVFTEDVILVTKNGSEVLTRDLPRTPEELENLMK